MSAHPPCPICGRPVARNEGETPSAHATRRYCTRRCKREGRRLSIGAAHPPNKPPQWPVLTDPEMGLGLSGQCFARHEVRTRPMPGRVSQPATLVPGGSALDGQD